MGKVGSNIAHELTQEDHDIVAIEMRPKVFEHLQGSMDIMAVHGNGASYEVQCEANVADCDLLIAVTSMDEINLLSCILAKKLGCKNTIARVRNPDYAQYIQHLREELGLSMAINPERTAAREIFRLLQYPSFLQRDTFAKDRVELVELIIDKNSPLINIKLNQIYQIAKVKTLICTVERDQDIFIPDGNSVLLLNDKITITADTRDLPALIKNLGYSVMKTSSVMIVGGSRIASYLATELIGSHIAVKIIEKNLSRCEELAELLPQALIIHGDGSEHALLMEEGLKQTDALITLTGIDEENMIISMYANHVGVPKTITKINKVEFASYFKCEGLGTIVCPKRLTAHEILRYVRAMSNTTGDSMLTLHRIMDEKAEALEFAVTNNTKYLNIKLQDIKLKKGILIACITRRNKVVIPSGSDHMQIGDTVVVVTTASRAIVDLNDIFENGTNHKNFSSNALREEAKI
jgi:trk system potassium uptake protein TrkA